MRIAKGCGSSCNGIYSLIFILETGMIKQWHATGIRDFSSRVFVADTNGQLSVTRGSRRPVRDSQKPASEDGRQRTHGKKWKKTDSWTPMGFWICVHTEEICQKLFIQQDSSPALPSQDTETFSKHQKNKPGILASSSRPPNSVQIKIGGEGGRGSVPLWFRCKSKIWKLHVWWGKHTICDLRGRNRASALIWPVIERHAVSLKQNKNPVSFHVKEVSGFWKLLT